MLDFLINIKEQSKHSPQYRCNHRTAGKLYEKYQRKLGMQEFVSIQCFQEVFREQRPPNLVRQVRTYLRSCTQRVKPRIIQSLCGLCCSEYKRTLSVTLIVKYGFSENAPQTSNFTGKSLLCSVSTGLCLRIKLQRCLPFRHKVKCLV